MGAEALLFASETTRSRAELDRAVPHPRPREPRAHTPSAPPGVLTGEGHSPGAPQLTGPSSGKRSQGLVRGSGGSHTWDTCGAGRICPRSRQTVTPLGGGRAVLHPPARPVPRSSPKAGKSGPGMAQARAREAVPPRSRRSPCLVSQKPVPTASGWRSPHSLSLGSGPASSLSASSRPPWLRLAPLVSARPASSSTLVRAVAPPTTPPGTESEPSVPWSHLCAFGREPPWPRLHAGLVCSDMGLVTSQIAAVLE